MLVLATCALGAGSAWASSTHVFEESFGPEGTSGPADLFEQASAVGVDLVTGDTYVADVKAGTVEKFDAAHAPSVFLGVNPRISGEKLTGFAFSVKEPLTEIAVNSTSHVFYVTNHGTQSVQAFQSVGTPAEFSQGPGKGKSEIGGFGELCGVAVDSVGDIYVEDWLSATLHVYAPSGEELTTFVEPHKYCNDAVDSHGIVYAGEFEGAVSEFVPSSFPVTHSTTYASGGVVDPNKSWGVAVDPSDDHLYVDERTQVAEYEDEGVSRLGVFGGEGPGALSASEGLAVSGAGRVYVSDGEGKHQVEVFSGQVAVPEAVTGEASEVNGHSAVLNGVVNPEGSNLSECVFEFVDAAHFGSSGNPYAAGGVVPCVPGVSGIPVDSSGHAVHADVSGLSAGTVYHFRLRAANAAASGVGLDRVFSTLSAPVITGMSSASETGVSAVLRASIDPGGLPATYRFEYGAAGYEKSVPAPDGSLEAANVTVPVKVTVTGLSANVTYHWRVVASSEAGTSVSPDHTFVYDTSGVGLPDGRGYEMVTPAVKNAAAAGGDLFGPVPDVARDGSRVVLSSIQCFADALSCPAKAGEIVGSVYQFERTPAGWVASSLEPPAAGFGVAATRLVDADVPGAGLFSIQTPAPAGLGEELYARGSGGSLSDIGPLFAPEGAERSLFSVPFAASADFSHVVWEPTFLNQALDRRFRWLPPTDETEQSAEDTLYEYVDAGREPVLVGVSGGVGSRSLISRCGTTLGPAGEVSEHGQATAFASEGDVVFFTALGGSGCFGSGSNAGVEAPVNTVYARVGRSETVAVSEPSVSYCSGKPVPACADALFEGASADGSRVFFTSTQQLTAGAVEGSENLYEAVLGRDGEGRMAVKTLVAVSGGGVGLPGVLGVVGISQDGSHVYFVAKGVLSAQERVGCRNEFEAAGVAEEGRCDAQLGADNLYVYSEGRVTFIAGLSSSDERLWNEGIGRANVTPDGRFLVFMSSNLLTADDSDASRADQVFRYDAASGGLVRVSFGEHGFNDNGNLASLAAGASIVEAGQARASSHAGVPRLDPTMSDDGRFVFFESPVALTPHALNEVKIGSEGNGTPEFAENVYEWAVSGAGSCPAGRGEGCVSLISDGQDTGGADVDCQIERAQGLRPLSDVCLLGVSVSGGDVFFTSSDRLVVGDSDTQLDVYDARVCGVEGCLRSVPPASGGGCVDEGCHTVFGGVPGALGVLSASSNVPSSSSSSSSSAGGVVSRAQRLAVALRSCRRRFRAGRRRVVCERAARRRYSRVRRASRGRAAARGRAARGGGAAGGGGL